VLDISSNKLSKVDRRLLESLGSLRRLNLAQGGSTIYRQIMALRRAPSTVK
jgi:hypothetical protein